MVRGVNTEEVRSADNATVVTNNSSTGVGSPVPLTIVPTGTGTPDSVVGGSKHTDTGVIAGAAIAGAVGMVVIMGLIMIIKRWILRRRAQKPVAFGDDGVSGFGTTSTMLTSTVNLNATTSGSGQRSGTTTIVPTTNEIEMRRERHKSELVREEQLQAVQARLNHRQEKWDHFRAGISH